MNTLQILKQMSNLEATLAVRDGKLIGKPKENLASIRADIIAHSAGLKRFLIWDKTGAYKKVFSKLRDAEIIIAADSSSFAAPEYKNRGRVYSSSELIELVGASKKELIELHQWKINFNGMLIGGEED